MCCPGRGCVFPAGSRGLLKLSQPGSYWKPGRSWQAGKCWERCRRRSGVGGSSFPRISAGQRRYFDFRITVSVELATLDNSYRKCYNKCNDNNKNVICHQTGKNAPTRRFAPCPYKTPMSRQKRRTTNLHKIW